MLLEGVHYDLMIRAKGREFRCHRDLLMARSPVMKSMLSHDMAERKDCVIDAPDCEPEAMEQFLLYVYAGKFESLNIMGELYYIADKYQVGALKEECTYTIIQSLSPDNLGEVVLLAAKHYDAEIEGAATNYFVDNASEVCKTNEWTQFAKSNPELSSKLLSNSYKK